EQQLPEQRYPNTKSKATNCESERNFVTFLSNQKGRRSSLNRTDVGHFRRIQSFIDTSFLQTPLEVLVVCLIQFSVALQARNLRSAINKLFNPTLEIAKLPFHNVSFRFETSQAGSFT